MTEKNSLKKSAVKSEKAGKIEAMYSQNPELKTTVSRIEKIFGEGAVMPLGLDPSPNLSGIPTGCHSLDAALGGCGVPKSQLVEIFGPELGGKTTLALHIIANAQKAGGIAAFIDTENASFDASRAERLGVVLETLLVSQPGNGEEAMRIIEMLVKSNTVDVIVVGSATAIVPKKELKGEIDTSPVAYQAGFMGKSLEKLTDTVAKSKTCVIFINHFREKVGIMFGPSMTPGNQALKHYCSCRIEVNRIGQVKKGDDIVGQRVKAMVAKNKLAPPFRAAEFDLRFDDGISNDR